MRLKTLNYLTAFALMTGSLTAYSKSNKVLATVGSFKITEDQYKEALKRIGAQAMMINSDKTLRIQLLDQLINLQVFSEAAKKSNYHKKKEYLAKIESFKKETLANMLLKERIDKQMNDKNIKDYYEKNKSKYASKQIRASHILLNEDDKKKADEILKKALKGDDFAELAKKNSVGPSASKGGDLNFFGPGQMVKEFEEAAFKTEKGKITPNLVKTRFGYHIIKVTDVKDGKDIKYDDKKAEVTRDYKNKARELVIEGLKKHSKVTVNKKSLEDMILN